MEWIMSYKTIRGTFTPLNARKSRICPPGFGVGPDGVFVPWRRPAPKPTRDAMPNITIAEKVAELNTLAKIVEAMKNVDARLTNLETRKKLAQQQLALQQPPFAQVQHEPPPRSPTQDARPCICQQQTKPPKTTFEDTTMRTHPGIAPHHNLTFSTPFRTRDQNRFDNYLEQPSRFTSQEADRMARYMPGAGKPDAHEHNSRGMMTGLSGTNERGDMHEAVSSDPSERFIGAHAFEQFSTDAVRPSAGALSALNRAYNKARDSREKEKIERDWRDYMSNTPRDAASSASQWRPKQPAPPPVFTNTQQETQDAPWTGLYQRNASVIGSNPDAISPGMKLDLGNGQSHVVSSGETLSGIQQQYGGGSGGIHPFASEGGGASPTGGSYSSGGDLKSGEGAPAGAPGAHNAANVPVPPSRPSDLGSSSGNPYGGAHEPSQSETSSLAGGGGDPYGIAAGASKALNTPSTPSTPSPSSSSSDPGSYANAAANMKAMSTGNAGGIHPLSEEGSGLSQSGGSSPDDE